MLVNCINAISLPQHLPNRSQEHYRTAKLAERRGKTSNEKSNGSPEYLTPENVLALQKD